MRRLVHQNVSVFASILIIATLAMPAMASASSGDLNCPDFGSRERAQFEFEKHQGDIYGLDGDGDGRACEWNGSTGWWSWPLASVALVGGRLIARKKKADHRVVPGIEGLWHNYEFHEDGGADKVIDKNIFLSTALGVVALPVVNIVRDYVLPQSFTPLVINALCSITFGVAAFSVTWRTNKIDEYR
jgi:hypothetical protein